MQTHARAGRLTVDQVARGAAGAGATESGMRGGPPGAGDLVGRRPLDCPPTSHPARRGDGSGWWSVGMLVSWRVTGDPPGCLLIYLAGQKAPPPPLPRAPLNLFCPSLPWLALAQGRPSRQAGHAILRRGRAWVV
ncbi:hypothetical protein LZ30DRAFT_352107 [Colletotrichum cereale]|nr:hypothetical protein LZ30DRAFT_352107 [Colletotrichum cereale]